MKLFGKGKEPSPGKGLIIFEEVSDVFKAEKILKKQGYEVIPVAPPIKYRKGCDLALEFELALALGIERKLTTNETPYVDIVAVDEDSKEPTKIIHVTDFADYTMVKSGNMKISFNKRTGEIVNISGGGCPDVPYLHACLVGKNLEYSPLPKDLGFTLCALMLDRAFEEALRLWKESECTS
jgi:hypothetical protein